MKNSPSATMTNKEKIYSVSSEDIKALYNQAYSLEYIYRRLRISGGKADHILLKERFASEGLDQEKFVKLQSRRKALVCKLASELDV